MQFITYVIQVQRPAGMVLVDMILANRVLVYADTEHEKAMVCVCTVGWHHISHA